MSLPKIGNFKFLLLGALILGFCFLIVGTTYAAKTSHNADLNSDKVVNNLDLAILASNLGKSGVTFEQGDINGDGVVNVNDLSHVGYYWGSYCGGTPTSKCKAHSSDEGHTKDSGEKDD